MKNRKILYLTQAGVIAALYFALTWASRFLGIADGAVQFRLSEMLTVLPFFTPAAVPGLAVGCFFSNIGSELGFADVIIGSAASLLAAFATRRMRKMTVKGLPLIPLLPPVLFNAVIVGLELNFFFPPPDKTSFLISFLMFAASVGAGQLVVCYGLGLPFFAAVKKIKVFK
ncbi:MAG: QueT transporter family protein [Oscillospiraceae bacterium]|nr:QueT transporter family protein [Oscillospiraceae bacterium]